MSESRSLPETDASVEPEGGTGVVISALAKLPERAIVDERALADALHVSKRTVRRMVSRGELPPPVPFAGRSMWQVQAVLAWFEARAARASREAERAARRMTGLV
jgi:predicted DNA-binding transcriptional regulator AlpA